MLFNSPVFIYLFLPITLGIFYLLRTFKAGSLYIKSFLVFVSFVFFGYWNFSYLPLLLISILINYYLGEAIVKSKNNRTKFLTTGVVLNLVFLGYYKYLNFFVDTMNFVFGFNVLIAKIILPLGISFYTFQQIGYLLDLYKGKVKNESLLDYALFVSFFPQLIAGPIVTYRELAPQFQKNFFKKLKNVDLIVGMVIFFIGLFKKAVIADNLSVYVAPVFGGAEKGIVPNFVEAWRGALSYTFQLYFDFSGYSDMAIGVARMFGLKLPMNFYSPFKSRNIIDFWRRWHMTLGRFIATDLFLPLSTKFTRIAMAQKRKKLGFFVISSAIPTVITFVLVGIWHGAGWTFVFFGFMHGVYMVINYAWRTIRINKKPLKAHPFVCWLMTFFSIIISFVIFRATTLVSGLVVLKSMFIPDLVLIKVSALEFIKNSADVTNWILFHKFGFEQYFILAFVVALLLPNANQFMCRYYPAIDIYGVHFKTLKSRFNWRPNFVGLVFAVVVSLIAILNITGASEFLYFQF